MDWSEIVLRLGVATVVGAAIGLDRELRHKSAGVRTIGLVSLGTALAVLIVTYSSTDVAAASRVLQGVVAGIGFLGAGVIMRHAGTIEGLTTAASIWTAAVLGAGCGLGVWRPVLIACGLVFLLLVIAGSVEKRIKHRSEPG
jgi:putative Mg2+ transporter-C (MgtC) family protein